MSAETATAPQGVDVADLNELVNKVNHEHKMASQQGWQLNAPDAKQLVKKKNFVDDEEEEVAVEECE